MCVRAKVTVWGWVVGLGVGVGVGGVGVCGVCGCGWCDCGRSWCVCVSLQVSSCLPLSVCVSFCLFLSFCVSQRPSVSLRLSECLGVCICGRLANVYQNDTPPCLCVRASVRLCVCASVRLCAVCRCVGVSGLTSFVVKGLQPIVAAVVQKEPKRQRSRGKRTGKLAETSSPMSFLFEA